MGIPVKWAVCIACVYEAFSITTGRTPTITALCRRYPHLGPAIELGLAIHLADPDRP